VVSRYGYQAIIVSWAIFRNDLPLMSTNIGSKRR
jgi:hypothetical protein